MKLLIISHTPHAMKDGRVVGWGATVREIEHLASLFSEVVHVAPLHPGTIEFGLPYLGSNIQFRSVPPSGGETLREKLSVLTLVPLYARTILKEFAAADVVHVRSPANISLVSMLLLTILRKPRLRWVKYAGSWSSERGEAFSHKIQRWWLGKGLQGGVVTVNGEWPNQPKHVKSFLNPCLTQAEVVEAEIAAEHKQLTTPVHLLYVGRLERSKGTDRVLRIASLLKDSGLEFRLDLVGDDPSRKEFETLAVDLNIASSTTFHGWLTRKELAPFYSRAHIMLLPSDSEGWPKVLSEAMAHGVVPLSSRVGSITQYLERFSTGAALKPDDLEGFAGAVMSYCSAPEKWEADSRNAVKAARLFTYEKYLDEVRILLEPSGVFEIQSSFAMADLSKRKAEEPARASCPVNVIRN